MSETRATYQPDSHEPKTYNDYVFWTRAKGDVLSTESLPSSQAEARARELAREYKTTVSYGIVLDYFIDPVFCAQCGEVMPENGPCECSLFEEEEPDGVALADFCSDHPYKRDYNPWGQIQL